MIKYSYESGNKGEIIMLVTTKELFAASQKGKFAIPAPNFINFDTAKAYVLLAESLNLPLILSFAEVHTDILTIEEAASIGLELAKSASVPVALHLDHGMTPSVIKKAIDLGFSSVMIDASSESFDKNVALTREIIAYAHPKGVVVEAEIGHVGSGVNYENHEHTDSLYTEVDQAMSFVEKTNVDSLAISIGTAHGEYKGKPEINFTRLEEISHKIDTPLVLHGGSSSGDDNLSRCARNGISKINIFTDLVNAGYAGIKDHEDSNLFELRDNMMKGMQACLAHYYEVFNTKPIKVKGAFK